MVQPHFTGRTRLIEAADACFRSAPYGAVGVAGILEIAGVRAPTLYHHFKDKEELYVDWAEAALSNIAYTFDRTENRMFAIELEAYARHLIENSNLNVVQLLSDMTSLEREDSHERIYCAYAQSIYEPLCGIFLTGIDRAEVNDEPIKRLADTFLAGIWALRGPKGLESELARWWVGVFTQGITRPAW
jgi:AcrR family transcriptional regulator